MNLSILNKPVTDLNIPRHRTRALNVLASVDGGGIKTVGQLISFTETELLKRRNFGKASLYALRDALEEIGLCFGMWSPPSKGERWPVRGQCEKCMTPTNWIVNVNGRFAYWCGCGN